MMPKRSKGRSRLENNKKIAIIVSFLIILFIILTYTVGNTFAWFLGGIEVATGPGEAGQIDTHLDFKIQKSTYGIPGATQAVSEVNEMNLGDRTEGYIFKIDYIVETDTLKNVENLGLSKDIVNLLGLIEKHPIDTTNKVVRSYYGKQTDPNLSLGELFVKFKEVSEFNINDRLDISVELNVVQIDKDAFQDAFNISDSEMSIFNSLFI